MERKLSEFLPWNNSSRECSGKFLLCVNQMTLNGKFIFYSLLTQLLQPPSSSPSSPHHQDDHVIYYISFNDQRYHLEYLLRKYGINLAKYMDNGLIYFYSNDLIEDENLVNGYDETIDSSGKFISVTLPPPISDSLITASTSSFSTKIMELFHRIETSSKPPIIFLDDLCGIELGFDDNGISFLALLHSYLSAGKIHSIIAFGDDYMVDMFHGDPVYPQDGEGVLGIPLVEYCKNRADILTIASPLTSGYSSDVHGQILITQPSSPSMAPLRLLYRATDTAGVRCCVSK